MFCHSFNTAPILHSVTVYKLSAVNQHIYVNASEENQGQGTWLWPEAQQIARHVGYHLSRWWNLRSRIVCGGGRSPGRERPSMLTFLRMAPQSQTEEWGRQEHSETGCWKQHYDSSIMAGFGLWPCYGAQRWLVSTSERLLGPVHCMNGEFSLAAGLTWEHSR